MLYIESEAVTEVWNSLFFFLNLDVDDDEDFVVILIMGSALFLENDEDLDGFKGPGKSCLRGAFDDMIMLYISTTAENIVICK